MVSLLLPVIYLAFISLGLPDSLLGSAWPVMYPELGTSVSSATNLSNFMKTSLLYIIIDLIVKYYMAGEHKRTDLR